MELNDAVDKIYELAANGDEKVYSKLSEQSINELKEYTKQEVVESLEGFFKDKYYINSDTRVKETFDQAETYFGDHKTKECTRITLTKEQQEWKIVWNLRAFLSNR